MTAASQYYRVTSRVGVPHRHEVGVTVPLVGPVGPQGPQGAQGPPGEVSGTLAWDNVTGKPATFPPSAHNHVAADVTDFAAAVAAVSPPVDWNSLTGKPSTFTPSAHTHTPSEVGLGNVSNAAQVTSVTGTAPIVSSGGTTPAISISAATTSAAGSMSAADKLKLDGIAAGAEVNVNADWNASSGDAQILNKPTIPSASSTTPSALGVAAAGSSNDFARADHVHAVPSAADVGAAPATGIDPTAITGTAVVDNDARLSDSRTPTTHAASHAAAGSDPVFNQDLNTTDNAEFAQVGFGGDFTIDAVGLNWAGQNIFEVETNTFLDQAGNTAFVVGTLCEFYKNVRLVDAGSGFAGILDAQGALSADRNYSLPDADGTIMLVGDAPAAHALTSASHTAGNHKVFYSDGSGQVQELALGNSGEVLTSNGATSAPSFAAASGGDTVSINASAADVLSVASGEISADDGGTINSQNPSIQWDDVNDKLIYGDPFIRNAGAMQIGRSGGNSRGTDSVNIQPDRNSNDQVASGDRSVAVGDNTRASGTGSVAIGNWAAAIGSESIAIGTSFAATFGAATASGAQSIAMGRDATASGQNAVALGFNSKATGTESFACCDGEASGTNSFAAGNVLANLRSQFATRSFSAVWWGGSTTDDTATVLNLDGAATNRFTIAASTALAVDILLVARRSDTADKWLVARRFLGIRRDGSNNTSLIGSVQTLGTDQSDGSPTWSFTLTADDTNEALQLEVTGAASETVQWRATAFYRVV